MIKNKSKTQTSAYSLTGESGVNGVKGLSLGPFEELGAPEELGALEELGPLEKLGVRCGVSKRVEDGCRSPTL
jgi:hypothetical protein